MALKYLTHINLNQNQLQNAVIHPLGTAPSGPTEGQIYYNSTSGNKKVYIYDGSAWTNISGDISEVIAGNALTGGGNTGSVTLNVAVDDSTIEINSDALRVKAGGIGANELAATSVTAGSYGSSSAIPTFTVDADGRLTAAGTASITTTLDIAADSGTDNGVVLGTDTLTIAGTTNEIETAASKNGTDVTLQIGLPDDVTIGDALTVTGAASVGGALSVDGNVTLGNNPADTVTTAGSMTVGGNLTVNGTTTSVNSTEISLDDPVLMLADNTSAADGIDRGVRFKWHDGTEVKEGFFGFDIQTQRFSFTKDEDFSGGENASSPWHDAKFGGLYAGNITVGITNDNTINTTSGNLVLNSAGGI